VDHISDELLEQYAMGNPVPPETEEHLLLCFSCMQRLESTDEFIAAMRAASAR